MSFESNYISDEKRIDLVINGIPGYAEASVGGWGFNGKWASHTGYKHTYVEASDADELEKAGVALYEEQSHLCYLVGDEHKDFGWKKIKTNMVGLVEIRIPQWASKQIKDALLAVGMSESCPLNCYWVFKKDVQTDNAKEVLEPLLKAGTRFSDEADLAAELVKSFHSSELMFNENQLSLF